MATRQTLNVSLPPAQEQFVRGQVAAGHYRTASEVVRDGLRLLEETEHRRLVEKWLYEDLSPDELALVPDELKERTRAYFSKLVEKGIRSGDKDGWIDGPEALDRLAAGLREHRARAR